MLSAISDVILMYLTDTKLVFRLQRDRYGTLYETDMTTVDDCYLEEIGMATNWRFYAWMTRYQNQGYIADSWHSDIYPYPMSEIEAGISLDRVLSGTQRTAIITDAFYEGIQSALNGDLVLSGGLRDAIISYVLTAGIESKIAADEVLQGTQRTAIITLDPATYWASLGIEEAEMVGDEVLTGTVRLAILSDTADTEEIEMKGDLVLAGAIA